MLKTRTCRGSPRERGAITPILAVSMAMALGLMALTVDLGQLFVGKNELQNIADAAALAGAKKLIQAKDPNNPGLAAVYCSEAITTAQAIAAENRSSGAAMTVTGADVTVGQWNLTTGTFTRTGCSANPMEVTAIQVTVRRDGTDNPSLGATFGNMVGGSATMNTSATAVAYLGLAGTSSLSIPFGVPTNYPAGQSPYVRTNPLLDWLLPRPAIAADPQPYTWKDLGGTTLDTSRATFIMPTYGERTSLSNLQKYIKGQDGGGLRYPQVQTGQKVYPISEYRWTSNVYNNFNYMKNRFNAEKDPATGKWRVTVAVYGTTDPLAAAPTPNPWLKLAQRLLPGPTAAYACASYTSPAVWVQGFVTLDIKKVLCDSNGDGVWDTTCKNYSHPDNRSCYQKCYMEVEVPLNQNFVSYDQSAKPTPVEQSYQDMNPSANNVGNFASVPFLVK
jgi:Flp pilus assembly protein TadG